MKEQEAMNPTQDFFQQAKKCPWVFDLYIAIQSAMAFGVETVDDFNRLADSIMPRADRSVRSYTPIGERGLEILGILFVCECIEKGKTDYHEYRFTRKSDGKSVTGTIKV